MSSARTIIVAMMLLGTAALGVNWVEAPDVGEIQARSKGYVKITNGGTPIVEGNILYSETSPSGTAPNFQLERGPMEFPIPPNIFADRNSMALLANTRLRTDLLATGFIPIGGGGGGEEEEEEEEPEGFPLFQSILSITATTDATLRGTASAAGNFGVNVSETETTPGTPAFGRVNSKNDTASDFLQFRIDPLGTQLGDDIQVELDIDYNAIAQYGNEDPTNARVGTTVGGLTFDASLLFELTVNGVAVDLGGYTPGVTNDLEGFFFDAKVGDTIGIKYDMQSSLLANGLMPPNKGQFPSAIVLNKAFIDLSLPQIMSVTPDNPLLPKVNPLNPGDPFVILTGVADGDEGPGKSVPIWFDPILAIGYDIEILGGEVDEIFLPPTPFDDSIEVLYHDGSDFISLGDFESGEMVDASDIPDGVTLIRIADLDESLVLDPLDPAAFAVGLTFRNVVGIGNSPTAVQVTMTPLLNQTAPPPPNPNPGFVPEPATLTLFGLAGLVLLPRQRRRRVTR